MPTSGVASSVTRVTPRGSVRLWYEVNTSSETVTFTPA